MAKAVASESGANFYASSASAFVEMFAGLGAARIRKLFAEARKNAPAIIFIDELDAVGAARTGHGFNREQDQTLNQLLVELDGFGASERVVVMSASNRLQDLDPALLRPGRFDRQMLVSPPDLGGREAILNVHTRGKPLAADVDLHVIAKQTAGLTGADLANICNEAAIFAGRKELQYLRHAEFDAAMERVVAGLQQRRIVTEKEKRILAYHEAGHAVVSHLTGDFLPVQKVTIVARGQALGYTLNLPAEDRYLHTKEELVDLMKVYLAGRAAEQVVFGRVTNGAANDLEKVTELARSMVFEYGMSEVVTSRTMRADNYALSEETKRLRDSEQARLTDHAYAEAVRLLDEAPAVARPRCAGAAREGDARARRSRGSPRGHGRGVALERLRRRVAGRCRSPARLTRRPRRQLASPAWTRAAFITRCRRRGSRRGSRHVHAALRRRARAPRNGAGAGRRGGGGARRRGAGRAPRRHWATTRPSGRFLASRGPGMHHVAFEVDGRPRRARVAEARGRRARRRGAARGAVRARGRVRPSRFRPRRSRGGGVPWLNR